MIKPIFIAGEWKQGGGEITPTYFPGDGSEIAKVSTASLEDLNAAVEGAEKAWRKWRHRLPSERAAVLFKAADIIESRIDELAQLQTKDNGKTMSETRALVMSAINTARYFASSCNTLDDALTNQRAHDFLTMSRHEPLGVIAAITPWNSPIASEMQKLAPALAAGNAVILKPAEATPLMALELAKIFEEAGLPKGLLSVLPGRGSVIGEALAKHPLVRKISFTGGTSTGRRLAHVAAEKLITTSLELGGKSPVVVLPDADLEAAAKGIVYGIFSSTGQACIAGSRLFIHDSIYDALLEKILEYTRNLRVGHPEKAGVHIGPLISEQHLKVVDDYVRLAEKEGGEVILGGQRLTGGEYDKGAYYPPTIITGLQNRAQACQEEIFGPVLIVLPYRDEAELIKAANDNEYGLAAGIWTRDYKRAFKLADLLEAGTIWINTYKKFSISAPFGGFKNSGIGREKGREGILAYMQQKSIYLDLAQEPNNWCQ